MSTAGSEPLLAAVLIVRDEEAALPGCLASLELLRTAGVLGVVHVHDTGSTDATIAVATAAGALVTRGAWTGDFAAARNAALAPCRSPWVLSLDADERVVADTAALASLLAAAEADAYAVEIANAYDTGGYTHTAGRLFRRGAVRWTGRVHEHLVTAHGPVPLAALPPATLRLTHDGYAVPEIRRAKAERNAALAQAELDALVARGVRGGPDAARVLLDLGRSLVGAGRDPEAAEVFETLRALCPHTPQARQGTDALARLALAHGLDGAVVALAGELRDGGVTMYADWLEAQARAQLGDAATAYALLANVAEVVDTAGRRHDPAQLAELKRLVASLTHSLPPRSTLSRKPFQPSIEAFCVARGIGGPTGLATLP